MGHQVPGNTVELSINKLLYQVEEMKRFASKFYKVGQFYRTSFLGWLATFDRKKKNQSFSCSPYLLWFCQPQGLCLLTAAMS